MVKRLDPLQEELIAVPQTMKQAINHKFAAEVVCQTLEHQIKQLQRQRNIWRKRVDTCLKRIRELGDG